MEGSGARRRLVHKGVRRHRRRRSCDARLRRAATRTFRRSEVVAAHGVGARCGTRCTAVRASLAKCRACAGTGTRAPPSGALDAGAVSRRPILNSYPTLFRFLHRTRAAVPRTDILSPIQVRWLGALLVAALLPQAVHLPLGIAVLGLALIALRVLLISPRL